MEISYGEIFGWFGGVVAVSSGVSNWIGQLILNKNNENWRGKTEAELRVLESNLLEKASILSELTEMQKTNYNLSQEKRIIAIEKAWLELESLKAKIHPSINYIYDKLTKEEITELNTDSPSGAVSLTLNTLNEFDHIKFATDVKIFSTEIYKNLPFLGFELWTYFERYGRFFARISLITRLGLDTKNNKPWYDDRYLKVMLQELLQTNEFEYLMQQELYTYTIATEMVESGILKKIDDVLSGKTASDNSFEHLKHYRAKIQELDNKTAP